MLPIGLHLGGNWALLSLFGWHGGEATNSARALWTAETPSQAHALSAPDLLPHLQYLAAVVVHGDFRVASAQTY